MIVLIKEQSSLSAVQVYLEPSTPPDERKADLSCLIAIPPQDRHYDAEQRIWTIKNPMRYTHILPILKAFIKRRSTEKAKKFRD
jgi:hypothetical protein